MKNLLFASSLVISSFVMGISYADTVTVKPGTYCGRAEGLGDSAVLRVTAPDGSGKQMGGAQWANSTCIKGCGWRTWSFNGMQVLLFSGTYRIDFVNNFSGVYNGSNQIKITDGNGTGFQGTYTSGANCNWH